MRTNKKLKNNVKLALLLKKKKRKEKRKPEERLPPKVLNWTN